MPITLTNISKERYPTGYYTWDFILKEKQDEIMDLLDNMLAKIEELETRIQILESARI